MAYINPWSISNKSTAIQDFIDSNQFDILAIAESWLQGKNDGKPQIVHQHEMIPNTHAMIFIPRPEGRRGGGLAVIYRKCFAVKVIEFSKKKSDQFEYLVLNVCISKCAIRLIIIYRPNPTSVNNLNVVKFWQQFESFLSKHVCCTQELFITGDLNFHLDKPGDSNTKQLLSVLSGFGLEQKISEPTHVAGHTLDVFITRYDCPLIESISVVDPMLYNDEGKLIRDHYSIQWQLHLEKPGHISKLIQYRDIKNINYSLLTEDLTKSELVSNTEMEHQSASDLVKHITIHYITY